MLVIKPNCELCDKDLPADSNEALICSYECTFCSHCVENVLQGVCPNCGGGFTIRPVRPTTDRRPGVSLAHQPASKKRVHTHYTQEEISEFCRSVKSGKTVKIVVASLNPVKVGAVRAAFLAHFPSCELDLIPLSVASDVPDQPMSDEETRQGARNRVRNSRQACPEADYWVGLEGGLDIVEKKLLAFAWMTICDRSDTISEARSASLPLPPAIQKLVEAGLELGEANDQVFSTVNSKQGGGAFGLLTDGLYTREDIYTQTLVLALVPFVNELWP